jgi:hypothetical protein
MSAPMPMISSSGSPDGTEALVSDLDAVVVGSERSHRLPVDVVDPAFTETLSRCNSAGPVPPADGACHGGAVAHELAIVALDGCMASAVADVLQVANGMVLRGGGSPVVSVRVATPSGGDASGFGRRTIRADASLAELGNVDVVVLPPFSDGLDDLLAAHPDLVVSLKSRAAEDVLLMSRKHPQRTPPPRRWWQRLNMQCAQTPGAGWAAEHTVGRVRRLRRRCGHSALTLAVLPEPRISVVHQPHWFHNRKFRMAGGASLWGAPGSAKANPARPRQR